MDDRGRRDTALPRVQGGDRVNFYTPATIWRRLERGMKSLTDRMTGRLLDLAIARSRER